MATNAMLFITLGLLNFMCISFAFDPRPLTDFCVADPTGRACKDPNTVTANDFLFRDMNRRRKAFNPYGVVATQASAATVPGFNAMGLTLARVEFLPNGYLPPHTHPRASEIIWVVEGEIKVGFVTNYPDYRYYYKTLSKGDAFMIPVGLVHTVQNVARTNSVMTASFNSQNPGFAFIPDVVFAAEPEIDTAYLAGAFKLDRKTVKDLQEIEQWFVY